MALGTRSLGTRSLGDSAGEVPPAVITVSGSAVLAGDSTFTGTYTPPSAGSVVFAGASTISTSGTVVVHGRALLDGRSKFIATHPFIYTFEPETQKTQYRLRIVDKEGNGYADLDKATIKTIGWELNGIGSVTFSVPTLDPKALFIRVPEREVQVWRGAQLIWWGVMVRAEANDNSVDVQCSSLEWYFTKRFFGKVDRTNHLQNPSFEEGASHWDIDYLTYAEPTANINYSNFVWSIVDEPVVLGGKALRLQQTGTIKYGFKVSQGFLFTQDPAIDPEGTQWTFAIWVYIPSDDWVAANEQSRGISVTRYSTTQSDTVTPEGGGTPRNFPKVVEAVNVSIDDDTPMDTWVRFEAELVVPFKNNEPEQITCRVVCPNGTIYLDAASFTAAEKLGAYSEDQTSIISRIIEHAQDPDYGKSDLNINYNLPPTGIKRTREYWHSEHQIIGDALDEFSTLENGVDLEVVVGPNHRIYTSYFPRKGIYRPDIVLEHGRNIEDFTVYYDGIDTANSIVVLGDGEGSDREEGGAMDATALEGGLILEKVYNATPGSHIQTLDDQAARGLERFKSPFVVPNITTHEHAGRLIGVLGTGDIVSVRINYGFVQVNDLHRIHGITLDPNTERLTYSIAKLEFEL
jgi:hypothetical protein